MSALLYRLGRSSARHPFRVLGMWLVAAIAIMSLQGSVGGEFKDNFRVPGVESQKAADILKDRFPTESGTGARITFHSSTDRLDTPAAKAAIDQTRQELSAGKDVGGTTDPFDPQAHALSADGQTAYVDVRYTVRKLELRNFDDATRAAATTRAAGVQTEFDSTLASVRYTTVR